MGTGTLRVCGALLGLWLAPCAWAAPDLPFERSLADRPVFDPNQGFGFDSSAGDRFFIQVPEGNYRVTVRLTSPRAGVASVWAEQRRLMVDAVKLPRGGTVERHFIVNVRGPALGELPDNATGGTAVRLKPREMGSATWDDRLSVAIVSSVGARLAWLRIEPVDVPTLYLAGDSTVTDQAVTPNASWGQFLTNYLRPDMAVANHAESGESLKSFVTGQRFDKLLSKLRPGDWVMLQFGHNDQKAQWPQTFVDAAGTYRTWLRVYVDEIRRRGATPLFVTSPERRNFDEQGRIRPTLAEYAQAMREVARELGVACIDLNTMSVRLYEALGIELSPLAFADGGDDRTHHNEYGARQLARAVIEGLRGANDVLTAGLPRHISPDAGAFDPSDPPLPDRKPRHETP